MIIYKETFYKIMEDKGSSDEAIAAWNRRADDEDPYETLRKECENCIGVYCAENNYCPHCQHARRFEQAIAGRG